MGNNCTCLQKRCEDSQIIEKDNDFYHKDIKGDKADMMEMNGGSLKESLSVNEDNGVSPMVNGMGGNNVIPNVNNSPSSTINLIKAPTTRKTSTKKSNNSEARKSPLEVINELNGEISKGSGDHKDHSSLLHKEVIKEDALKSIDCKPGFINQAPNYNHSFNYSDDHKVNDYFSCNNDNNKHISTEDKKGKSRVIQHSAQKKPLKDIIPLSKLKYLNENDLLLQGEFYKSTKDKDTKRFILTSNFLFLTKSQLRIYRSKEAVIYRQSPLQTICLGNIVSCEFLPLHTPTNPSSSPSQRYTFVIEYLQMTNGMRPDLAEKMQNNSQFDSSLSKIQFDSSMMKNKQIFKNSFKQTPNDQSSNVIDPSERKKGKKMTLLGSDKEEPHSVKKNDDLFFENNASSKIYFSFENGDCVMKWVSAINYLISR